MVCFPVNLKRQKMKNNLKDNILNALIAQRGELVKRLVSFVSTDTILFLSECQIAENMLRLVNNLLCVDFVMAEGLNIPPKNLVQTEIVERYLLSSSAKKTALIYLVATELRSVLLGILWAENKASNDEVFDCAFFEELQEQKKWGKLPEIEAKHLEIRNKLADWEMWKNEGSLS